MIRVVVNGALGYMGSILTKLINESDKFTLVSSVDAGSQQEDVLKNISQFEGEADIVIDFSHHTAAPDVINWSVAHKTPVIVATTGHTLEEKSIINGAGNEIPVFYSANMSLGIALVASMAKKAAAVFPNADIEIVERHHNRKIDAPSGTALLLAESVKESRPDATIVCGRSGMSKRGENEIGVSSLRLGNLPGTHEVIINTGTQSITLTHEVYDRALFAEGALDAAEFLIKQEPGVYSIKDIFND
jgi:4-hydroxy-tetrahydrodipicolinate reductase